MIHATHILWLCVPIFRDMWFVSIQYNFHFMITVMIICLFNIFVPGSIPGINYLTIYCCGCERRAFNSPIPINAIIKNLCGFDSHHNPKNFIDMCLWLRGSKNQFNYRGERAYHYLILIPPIVVGSIPTISVLSILDRLLIDWIFWLWVIYSCCGVLRILHHNTTYTMK